MAYPPLRERARRFTRALPRPFTLPLLALPLFAAACGAESAALVPSRELTLRHVVLYQNGVGYFERTGTLKEDRLRLQFRSGEVDDVLKTLVVVESGAADPGRKPSTVTVLLPRATRREAAPAEDTPTWLDVVLSPKPAKELSIAYAVPTAAWKSAYRVILPENPEKSKGVLLQAWALIDNISEEDWKGVKLTLATGAPLTFDTDLRSVRTGSRPTGGGFEEDFRPLGPVEAERLAAADTDRDGVPDAEDACPNELGAPDQDRTRSGCPRAVRVTSSEIRILQAVFFDKDADAIKPASFPLLDEVAQILLQHPEILKLNVEGHAQAGERDPWGVSARRAGAVRSYLLRKGVRTELTVMAFGDSRPIAESTTPQGQQQNRRVSFRIEDRERQNSQPAPSTSAPMSASNLARTAGPAAVLRDIAGMIRYDITYPVTIPRMSSTLVTIINQYIPGEEIYLYRPDANMPGSDRFPMRAARLENKSGFGLQSGPVAIYGGGTFVGEGLLGKLNPGDTALIPYGIDSSTKVDVEPSEVQKPRRLVSLARGTMSVEDSRILTTRYTITPGAQVPARIFLRHRRGAGFSSAGSLPPGTETTDEAHLIPIPIAPRKTSVVTIEETKPQRSNLSILDADGPRLAEYLQNSGLSADDEKRVRDVVAMRTAMGRTLADIDALQTQLADTAQRSAELRESLRAIERTPRAGAVQQKLLDRLAEATKQAEDLSTKLASKNADLAEARANLTEALRDLRIEEKSNR
jgi:outer membrane protein OmpA-like peptidoglycan-associated protein